MKKLRTAIVYGGAIVLGLLIGMGLSLSRLDAQEITPEPVVEAVQPIVVEDGGLLIQESPQPAFDYSSMLILLASIAGIVFAGGGALMVLNNVLNSKAIKDNTEKLYEGLSPTWQTTIQRTLTIAEDVLRFARESTDRLPNTETPPATGITVDTSGTSTPAQTSQSLPHR